MLDLAAGTEAPLALTAPPLSAGRYARDPIALDAERALQVVDVIDFTATPAENTSELWAVGPGEPRKLYQVPTATSRIGRICPSPNGQYVAVEVIPGDAAPDDFPLALGYTDTTTYVVDTDDGSTRRGFLGFRPSWCD